MYSNHQAAPLEPPRGNLPSWHRSSFTDLLRKPGKVRQLQPNAILQKRSVDQLVEGPVGLVDGSRSATIEQEKVLMLERRLDFLRSQHSDTLTHLHNELDRLKAENKELNFKLVMCRCGMNSSMSREGRSRQHQRKPTPRISEEMSNEKLVENDLQKTKEALQKERKRNAKLTRVVEKMMQKSLNDGFVTSSRNKSTIAPRHHTSLLMSIDQTNLSSGEYRRIIEHLLSMNEQQHQEVALLKKDFFDFLCSEEHPPQQLMDRLDTYSSEHIDQFTSESRVVLPDLSFKDERVVNDNSHHHTFPKFPHDSGHYHAVQLPAIVKPSRAPSITHRQKKAIAPQRTRMGTFPR